MPRKKKTADETLRDVAEKLAELEKIMSSETESLRREIELVRFIVEEIAEALNMLGYVREQLLKGRSDIEKEIVSVLMDAKEPLNITEITEALRQRRGTASRGVVAQKLDKLEIEGIVERVKSEKKEKLYKLKTILDEKES